MSWDDAEKNLMAGPRSATSQVVKWIMLAIVLLTALGIFARAVGWFGGAVQVASEEFSARTMLTRYQWFKDAAAQLDGLNADIRVYQARQEALIEAYGDTPRAQWPRDDREEWNQTSAEVAGVKASYNRLAAEYNASMAKFNWAFTNAGQLPQGADQVLPREFRTYEVQ